MNLNVQLSLNAMVGEAVSDSDLVGWPTESIRFPNASRRQLEYDQELRLEERREERRRIARELHDTLFQGFLGASMLLEGVVAQTPADSPTKPSLNRALGLMYRVLEEGRAALQGLRANANVSLNLEENLHQLWDELTPGNVQFRIMVEGQPKALKPAIEEQIYLIGREAVLNALRHSGATLIEAEIEYSARRLRVVVRDNGCGMDPRVVRSGRESHWGLLGMRERAAAIAARVRIWSRPGSGTEVEVSLPMRIAVNAAPGTYPSSAELESGASVSSEMLNLLGSQNVEARRGNSARASN